MGHLDSRSPEFTDPELLRQKWARVLALWASAFGADEEERPEYAHWGEG